MGCGASTQPNSSAKTDPNLDLGVPASSCQVKTFDASANGPSVGKEGGPVKVWLGFLKLDDKLPTPKAIGKLLFNSDQGSAERCDVIALLLTDMLIDDDTSKKLHHLLKKSMGEHANDFVFNEDDHASMLKHIPAILVTSKGDKARYCSMHIAVRKRLVPTDGLKCPVARAFPVPVYLAAKSSRRNEKAPTFKCVLVQEVALQGMDLVLLGANFDTVDTARLGQLQQIERLLSHARRTRDHGTAFSALIWGDFNTRLVAFDGLDTETVGEKAKVRLTDAGVKQLTTMIADPAQRRDLCMKDGLVYRGKDCHGNEYVPPQCNLKFSKLFTLPIDALEAGLVEVPMPSYKQTPIDVLLSAQVGCKVALSEVVCKEDSGQGLIHKFLDSVGPGLGPKDDAGVSIKFDSKEEAIAATYFGWDDDHNSQRLDNSVKPTELQPLQSPPPQRTDAFLFQRNVRKEHIDPKGVDPKDVDTEKRNLYLQSGWLDGVGIYKGGSGSTGSLVVWETESQVQAFDHLPLRAVVDISFSGRKDYNKLDTDQDGSISVEEWAAVSPDAIGTDPTVSQGEN